MADLEELGLDEVRALIEGSGEEGPITGVNTVTNMDFTDRARDRVRVPWVFTSRRWVRENRRKIVMWVNPGSIDIELPKRASLEKTAGGAVMHQLKIRGREDVFDEFEMTFEANTGNIMPVTIREVFEGAHVPALVAPGLVNQYDMNELQAQSHQIEETGEANFIYVYMSTPAYPRLTLVGWFDPQAYSFSEDAENPNSIRYNLKLSVLSTEPKLTSSSALLQAFRAAKGAYLEVPDDPRR